MKHFTRRTSAAIAVVLTAGLALSACASTDSVSGSGSSDTGGSGGGGGTITVGSANFPENQLLGEIYAQAIEAQGLTVNRKFNIGSREVYIKALDDGSIDLIPEYTGALAEYYAKAGGAELTASSPDEVFTELEGLLPDTLTVYDKSEAEDKDSVAVTQETADKYSLTSLEDLTDAAKDLVIGGPSEFETRRAGLVGLKDEYGLTFKEFKALDAGGPLTVKALVSGDIQLGNIFSTQSEIKTNNFVILEDPKSLFVAQNILPLISKSKGSDDIKAALDKVSAALTTEILTDLLSKVTVDKSDYDTVAKSFINDNGLAG